MKVLLLTPPMTQLNSPYPATAYLSAHLRRLGHEVRQADLGLELALALFSSEGLRRIRDEILRLKAGQPRSESVEFFLEAFADYQETIDPVIAFLQGKDPTLALRIAQRSLLPEGPRFLPVQEQSETLLSAFGEMSVQDLAKYRASLYLDDIADVIREGVDPRFEFSRYAESLASSQASFSPLYESLKQRTWIDGVLCELLDQHLQSFSAEVVGMTVPFPGNVYGALRLGEHLRGRGIVRVMGGGFVNTELRQISDPRVFEFIDYLSFDDGEKPLQLLLESLQNKTEIGRVPSLRYLQNGKVAATGPVVAHEAISFRDLGPPDYEGLPLNRYVSMLEMPNPMHRLWSDFRWNKMILAHGCYWKKCTFCDVHLDYIGRYEPQRAEKLVDFMEQVAELTGTSGFHFVDEAAPPALLKALSEEILRRGLKFTWWGNLRFDGFFTAEIARLMADAGCVAVTGGIEVANARLLKLINKGITLPMVQNVLQNFKEAGIYVHAYLMFGFPSQTREETFESLENVRQLFAQGCLDSAHWHRFLCTAHSPVARDPEFYGVTLQPFAMPQEGFFARYEIPFVDRVQTPHETLAPGLRKAVYNYMHGVGLDWSIDTWFKP